MEGRQSDSIVLEEEIDPNYEPTEKEVLEYATWLGMDLKTEKDLFWIAREGLKAPLPENWKPCKTTDTEEIYYFNFASGQSTWDHPCDEFYRNLYEEHKQKPQAKGAEKTNANKNKVKEDVAELLGRKSSGKTKGSLSKAELLSGPLLGKVNVFEKKPLPTLSSKLGALGAGGLTSGALKPGAALGPRKSEAKELSEGRDSVADDLKSIEPVNPLSRTPLGNVFGKKPLASSPSIAMPVATDERNADMTSSEFNDKRENLAQEYTKKLLEIQHVHELELQKLEKKLKTQFEDVQDAEEMKLKQLKRDFDKKKFEMENQFDREENATQRRQKDLLKRLETETENALNRKKHDLDRELESKIDKLRFQHEVKQREIQEGYERETEQLTEKMKSLFGENTKASQVAMEMKAEVERLRSRHSKLEQELSDLHSRKDTLMQEKDAAEKELKNVKSELEAVKRQLLKDDGVDSSSLSKECTKCADLENRISTLKNERTEAEEKVKGLVSELARESELRAAVGRESGNQMIAFRQQEISLKQEIQTLQQQVTTLKVESSELKTKCTTLESIHLDTTSLEEVSSATVEALQTQLVAAQGEVTTTKSELKELKEQYAGIVVTNAQTQAQLINESNERKVLLEQLDLKAEEAAVHLSAETEKCQALQLQVKSECHARQVLEDTCNMLRKELDVSNLAKDDLHASLPQIDHRRDCLSVEMSNDSEMRQPSSNLQVQFDSLKLKQKELEQELDVLRREKEDLLHDKNAADTQHQLTQREIDRLQAQLENFNSQTGVASTSKKCTQCSVLEDQVLFLRNECTKAQMEMVEVREDLMKQKQEAQALAAAEREATEAAMSSLQQAKNEAAKKLHDQESCLKEKLAILERKVSIQELNTSFMSLQEDESGHDGGEVDVTSASRAQEQLRNLENSLVCQNDLVMKKTERHDLENENASLLTINTQNRDQVMKEEYETKMLRKHFESTIEEVTQRLALATEKQQQQRLSLEQQLESECRSRKEREEASEALLKKVHVLEQERCRTDAKLSHLETVNRHLEAEKSRLTLRLDEMNVSRKREEKSVISVEDALADKRLEVEQLRANLQVVKEDKEHLETRMKAQNHDLEQMQTKIHRLESDHESARKQIRTMEKENKVALQRQQGLAEELESSQRKCRALTGEICDLQTMLSKVKGNEQVAVSKAEKAAEKVCQLKEKVEREGVAVNMKLQQAQVKHANVVHLLEKATLQSQAKEKELSAAKDEIIKKEREVETLQARNKALLSDMKEVQAALLSANIANEPFVSAKCDSTKSIGASSDVMLVKLQLADANKTELELHLADISSQLEKSTSHCAALETRCRDQSAQNDLLHVEVASLRTACQKMHGTALESLPLVERLEYEHKKRTLKSDFLNQLRDFHEREEQALIRQKARLRAQFERNLDDLVAEFERVRQHRVEQEETISVQTIQQIRYERDLRKSEAKRQVRQELKQFEQELHERKGREIDILSKTIEREEEKMGARFRELWQVAREKELAQQQEPGNESKSKELCEFQIPSSPGQVFPRGNTKQYGIESLDNEVDDKSRDPVNVRSIQRNIGSHSDGHRSEKTTKKYQKWKKRLEKEVNLLVTAQTLVANQRHGLTRQAQQLKASKDEWKRSSFGVNSPQREVKRMFDENMANWSDGMRKLRKQEAWVKQREQKLDRMRRLVVRLKAKLSDVDHFNMSTSSDSSSEDDDDDEAGTKLSDYSNQSELVDKLERLLVCDDGELCGGRREFSREVDDNSGFHSIYQLSPSDAIQCDRNSLASLQTYLAPRRGFYAADVIGQDMRWPRCQRPRLGLRGDRFVGALGSYSVSRTEQVYQHKISRWAKGRKKVQHAATNHATWLSGLCDELNEYGAKYTRVEGELDDAGGANFGSEENQEKSGNH